jgi:ZIP family zinc transporter
MSTASAGAALFWGAFSSASLYIGEALAPRMATRVRATGLIMGFGAGTMLSAVAYELIPESSLRHGFGIAVAFALGALTYYVADRIVDERGGAQRQDIDVHLSNESSGSSGAAMFLGALLDGVPEAFVLGITIAAGGGISVAFVVAVFVSNIPQGLAGTTSLMAAGYSERAVFRMWTALTVAAALTAVLGYVWGDLAHASGLYAEAFAAGAVLTMLANSMMPEAFEHGGNTVGLLTVAGFLVAAILAVAS